MRAMVFIVSRPGGGKERDTLNKCSRNTYRCKNEHILSIERDADINQKLYE